MFLEFIKVTRNSHRECAIAEEKNLRQITPECVRLGRGSLSGSEEQSF